MLHINLWTNCWHLSRNIKDINVDWLSVSLSVQEGCSQLHQRGSIIEVINTCTWEDTVGQFIIVWANLLSKLKDAPSLLQELSSINCFCFSVLIWKRIFYYRSIQFSSINFSGIFCEQLPSPNAQMWHQRSSRRTKDPPEDQFSWCFSVLDKINSKLIPKH